MYTQPVVHEVAQPPRPLQLEAKVEPLPPPAQTPPAPVKPSPAPAAPQPELTKIVLAPATPTQQVILPVSASPRSGLPLAFELFLNNRADEARNQLKHLPVDDQDFALSVLPRLVAIERGELWPNLTGPQRQAILQGQRGLVSRLSKSAPLLLRKTMYIERGREARSIAFGEVTPRPTNTYRPEDYVELYAELINLVDSPGRDGLYASHITTTIEIRSDDNTVHYSDTAPSEKPASVSPRDDFFVNACFQLPRALPPGNYQLVIKVDDLDTGRTAKQTLTLNVITPKPRSSPKR
jgi:hypothetical protein